MTTLSVKGHHDFLPFLAMYLQELVNTGLGLASASTFAPSLNLGARTSYSGELTRR
jgi:hypothetical protein